MVLAYKVATRPWVFEGFWMHFGGFKNLEFFFWGEVASSSGFGYLSAHLMCG